MNVGGGGIIRGKCLFDAFVIFEVESKWRRL